MLGLGAINYFVHPTLCAGFLFTYMMLLQADFVKSIVVIKKGTEPWWEWKMKDAGYIINSAFGFLTLVVITKRGINHLKNRVVERALVAQK